MNWGSAKPEPPVWGISLAGDALVEERLPEAFDRVELPGSALDSPRKIRDFLRRQGFASAGFRNLADAGLSRQILTENAAMRFDFKRQMRALLAQAAEFGAATVSLDVELEAVPGDAEREAALADLVRSLAGDLYEHRIRLLLQWRLPGTRPADAMAVLRLLNRIGGWKTGIVLEINPHELLRNPPQYREVLAPLQFAVRQVRFAYETQLGNKLLFAHIADAVKAVSGWYRPMPIFFAPNGVADWQALATLTTGGKDVQ